MVCEQIGNDWMRFGAIKKIVTDFFPKLRMIVTQSLATSKHSINGSGVDKEVTFEFGP